MNDTTRIYTQVLNGSGLPASGPHNDLAIFRSKIDAESWITYLTDECGREDEFTTRVVVVSLLYAYPGDPD